MGRHGQAEAGIVTDLPPGARIGSAGAIDRRAPVIRRGGERDGGVVDPVGPRLIVEMDEADPSRVAREIVQGYGRGIGGRPVDEWPRRQAMAEQRGRRETGRRETGRRDTACAAGGEGDAGKTEQSPPGDRPRAGRRRGRQAGDQAAAAATGAVSAAVVAVAIAIRPS
jgi:hypothetical protein